MASANVTTQALRDFRVAMIKFIENVNVSLADADSDILRTTNWLELEQVPFWTTQIRKRQELVARCLDAVRQKTLYRDATGRPASAVDEQKALKKAQALLAEAEEKLVATKQYYRRIQKAHLEYRGQVSKLNLSLTGSLAECVAKLQALQDTVAAYGSNETPTEATSMAQSTDRVDGSAAPPAPGAES